jgi:hypothetical protein
MAWLINAPAANSATMERVKTAEEWAEDVRRAGRAGGLARAKKLTPEQRRASAIKAAKASVKARAKKTKQERKEIASKAAKARWSKKQPTK